MTRSFRTLWDQFLFRDKGIVPTTRLITSLGIFSIVVILLAVAGVSFQAVVAVNAAVILLSFLDLLLSPGKRSLTFKRYFPEEVERGLESEATMEVTNRSKHAVHFQVIDDFPPSFTGPFPLKARSASGQKQKLTVPFTAGKRGDYLLPRLHIRFRSLLGLWEKQTFVDNPQTIRVLPDLTESRQFLKDAQRFLLYEGSRIKKRQVGSGEFAKVRKYVVGDDLRKINWRQTAKLQEMMTNEYEPEHGKFITILIDCGRMMGVELKDNNRLERSLEAAMTVATAALKKGDAVAVLAFSKEVKVYIPPAKGMNHIQTIIKEVYNLQVDEVEPNYEVLFQHLDALQNKRSLLLLFSDVSTLVMEEANLFYLHKLRKKHLFLMLGIEDEVTRKEIENAPDTMKQAMVKSMAQKHVLEKSRELTKWERQGLPMVETPEEHLATRAVAHYIDIINRGVL